MEEAKERRIRDLKLRILHVERELAAKQHNVQLGAWLRAGHAAQMAKAGERERERLETKLKDLRSRLDALEPRAKTAPEVCQAEVPAEKPSPRKVLTPKREAAPKAAGAGKEKAATGKPAAAKGVKIAKKK